MGNYFLMSNMFNKRSATDFGLIPKDADLAIDPKNNTLWKRIELYDFGWGKENGYYKMPLPGFDILFQLALYSTDREDTYGAAAMILEKYPSELLIQCESIMDDPCKKREFARLTDLFGLKKPTNRCPIEQRTYEEIQRDYLRWKSVSEKAKIIKAVGRPSVFLKRSGRK